MSEIRFNAHYIIERAVEEGVQYGIMRSFKHTDNPTEDHLKSEIENAVMSALWEVIDLSGYVKIERIEQDS